MKFLRFPCVPGQSDDGKDNKAGYRLNKTANRAIMEMLPAFMMVKEDEKNSAQEQKRGYGQQFFIFYSQGHALRLIFWMAPDFRLSSRASYLA